MPEQEEEEKMGAGWGCTVPRLETRPVEAKPPETARPPLKEESSNSPVRMQTFPYFQ